ncbi:hypothetical protein ACVQ92_00190 [Staphylococcus aureus]
MNCDQSKAILREVQQKLGRDLIQVILPLRGKVINTEKARLEDIFKNEEINTIIHTIGQALVLTLKLKIVIIIV